MSCTNIVSVAHCKEALQQEYNSVINVEDSMRSNVLARMRINWQKVATYATTIASLVFVLTLVVPL